MDRILKIDKDYGHNLNGDNYDALYFQYKEKKVGHLVTFQPLSLYLTHNLTIGERGVVNTNGPFLERIARYFMD